MIDDDVDYRALFEQSSDILLVLLPDAPRFTMVAATERRLAATHTTREETLGRPLFEVFGEDPSDPAATGVTNLRESLERVLATRAADTMAVQKYDIRAPDGSFEARYWSPKNLPVLGADGSVRYILHRVEDVTDLVRAAELGEALRDRTHEMEREVLQRSRELHEANRALRDINAQLAGANRELDAFSYSVAHDLRSPLRAIDGFSRALAEDYATVLDQTGHDYVSRICAATGRMSTLIDALLGLARISRAAMNSERVDLTAKARNVAEELRKANPNRDVAVAVQDDLFAYGDRPLLYVLLTNLIGNAYKFTARRSDAQIAVGRVDGSEPAFFVRDNGAGFSMEFAARLFAPFQRLHSGREFDGTGIGLATAQRVVARHGGRIWAEAAVDQGATFFFTLPTKAPPTT